ncbi:hypothetical protein Cch01nite_02960 [Cellulomonas chitinilytica]|uniref:Heavy metal transporter n=1 Tax=Cellulomonas chitinilytica TaxID=398759 RepID=A0A919NXZ0_9CELL|nr:hypothetical protein Cch01nite_02960 [Cellulomonas chitinilytica]
MLVVLAAAVGVVVTVLRQHDATPVAERCAADVDGTRWFLDPDQSDNAALVAAVGVRRTLPARAVTIALATALQESKLRNLPGGDRDSLGIFQQRPSQGWGTPEEILDPVYSTGRFYDGLTQVDGYEQLSVTEAAQAVQRSGFPDAYAQHEGVARAYASALTGWSPNALTCTLADAQPGSGSAQALVDRVRRDLGDLPAQVQPSTDGEIDVSIDAGPLGPETDRDRLGWAVAQWAVAVAQPLAVTRVEVADQVWDRGEGDTWSTVPDAEPVSPGSVVVTLAG